MEFGVYSLGLPQIKVITRDILLITLLAPAHERASAFIPSQRLPSCKVRGRSLGAGFRV